MKIFLINKTKMNSFLAALYLSFFYVNAVIGKNGIAYINIFMITVLCFIGIQKKCVKIHREWIVIVTYILLIFLFSIFTGEMNYYTLDYLIRFFAFGIIGLLIGMQMISIRQIVKYMVIIGLLGLPIIIIRGYTWMLEDTPHAMGFAYAVLPILLISIMGVQYEKNCKVASFFVSVVILYFFSKMAPRGVILSIGVYILLLFYYHICIKKSKSRIAVKQIIIISIAIVASFYAIRNITELVNHIIEILETRFGIQIYALNKIIFYATKGGDISNGRNFYWNQAWKMVKYHIFWGNGIGSFESIMDTYPHNLFLQAINDAGIFLLIPTILIVFGMLLRLFFLKKNEINMEEYYYEALLFTIGIMPLFYSSSYWLLNPFWYVLGYEIKNIGNRKKGKTYAAIYEKKAEYSCNSYTANRI